MSVVGRRLSGNGGKFTIIQGGMGIGVSNWRLAKAVSLLGQIGVVSGAALEPVFVRRVQSGIDLEDIKRALSKFPFPRVAEKVLLRIHGWKNSGSIDKRFPALNMFSPKPSRELIETSICASFVEVFLAKENHTGLVGINLLEKIQLPHLFTVYGALLAGVNLIIVGAGIPFQFPDVITRLIAGEEAEYKLQVTGAKDEIFATEFSPQDFFGSAQKLERPLFFPIVSSVVLAKMLARNSGIDGFIVEEKEAGGHNAPPRGKYPLDEYGQPVYGTKDVIDYAAIASLGKPFYLGGGWWHKEKMQQAYDLGAAGVQLGSIFALCEESGFTSEIKQQARRMAFRGELKIFTDPEVSPTGFPFKVAQIPGTLSDQTIFSLRERVCDLGYLREPYLQEDGKVGFRCSAEPIEAYGRKGGSFARAEKSKCLCNALLANIGLGQERKGYPEPAMITLGDDVGFVCELMGDENDDYTAGDAVRYLTS